MADEDLKSAMADLSWPKGTWVGNGVAIWEEAGGGTGRSFECVGEMHPAGPRRIGGRPHLYSWEVVGTAHPYAEDESERMFLTGYSDDMGIPPALPEEAVEIMRGAFERCVEIARRGLRG